MPVRRAAAKRIEGAFHVTEIRDLDGPIADALRAFAAGALTIERPAMPQPVSGTWGSFSFDAAAERDVALEFEGEALHLVLYGSRWRRSSEFTNMIPVLNEPATMVLEDGSTLTSRLASHEGLHFSMRMDPPLIKQTEVIDLSCWTWIPSRPATCWVGQIEAFKTDDSNVHADGVRVGLRVDSNYDILVLSRGDGTAIIIVDTRGAALDHGLLGTDFLALEFALGRRMGLLNLVALDERLEVVGAAGVRFGQAGRGDRRCPVAGCHDLFAVTGRSVEEHLWVPVLGGLVAKRLHQEGEDSPLQTAVAAYLDSLEGHVHSNYLLAHVGLEAFCAAIAPQPDKILVKDTAAWAAWVKGHATEICAHALDPAVADRLVNKVINAHQVRTEDRVPAALAHYGLTVPPVAITELQGRHTAAHEYIMEKESQIEPEVVATRVAIVQTLLMAVIAKYVGFEGPIVGWEWVHGRHKVPDWWTWKPLPDAAVIYAVGRPEPPDGAESSGGGDNPDGNAAGS